MGFMKKLGKAIEKAAKEAEKQSKQNAKQNSRFEMEANPEAFTIAGASYRQSAFRQFAKESGCDRSGKRIRVKVVLMPEPDNPKDPDAIAVFTPRMQQLGYIPADMTAYIHAKIPPINRKQTWKITATAELYWWKNLYLVNIWS